MMKPRYFLPKEININDFKKGKRLNQGGFGIVYQVEEIQTGQQFAAKIIDCADNEEKCKKIIEREVLIMIFADHPTIIKFYGYSSVDFQNEHNVTIIMELAKNGSLADVIKRIENGDGPKDYSATTRQKILIGIARGMKYLHDRNIIHRDLKPGNILLDDDFRPLITDFGFSKQFQDDHLCSQTFFGGTIPYQAPEIITKSQYDIKADVYAFGIMMFEIVTDSFSYPELKNGKISEFDFKIKVTTEKYRPKSKFEINKSLQHLIEECWSDDPKERPTFDVIYSKLSNEIFLDEVDFDELKLYIDDISEITDKIEQLLKTIYDMQEEQHKLNKKISEMEAENRMYRKKISSIEDENKELKNDKLLLKKENDSHIEEVKKLKKENDSHIEEITKLKKENYELQEENNKIRNTENKPNSKNITKDENITPKSIKQQKGSSTDPSFKKESKLNDKSFNNYAFKVICDNVSLAKSLEIEYYSWYSEDYIKEQIASKLLILKSQIKIINFPKKLLDSVGSDYQLRITIECNEISNPPVKQFYFFCRDPKIDESIEIDTNKWKDSSDFQRLIESQFSQYDFDIKIKNPPILPLKYIQDGQKFEITIENNRYSNSTKNIQYKIKDCDFSSFLTINAYESQSEYDIKQLIASDLQIKSFEYPIQIENMPKLPLKYLKDHSTLIITIPSNEPSDRPIKTFRYEISHPRFSDKIEVDTNKCKTIEDLKKLIVNDLQVNDYDIDIDNPTKLPLKYLKNDHKFNLKIKEPRLNDYSFFRLRLKNSNSTTDFLIETKKCKTVNDLMKQIAAKLKIDVSQIVIENPPKLPIEYIKFKNEFIIRILKPENKISFNLPQGKTIQAQNYHRMRYYKILDYVRSELAKEGIYYFGVDFFLKIEGKELKHGEFPLINVEDGSIITIETSNFVTIKYQQMQFNFRENEDASRASKYIKDFFQNCFSVSIQDKDSKNLYSRIQKSAEYKIKVEILVHFLHHSSKYEFKFHLLQLDYFATILDAKQQLAIIYHNDEYELTADDITIFNQDKQEIKDSKLKLVDLQRTKNDDFYFDFKYRKKSHKEKKKEPEETSAKSPKLDLETKEADLDSSLTESKSSEKHEKKSHKKIKIQPLSVIYPVQSPSPTEKSKRKANTSEKEEKKPPQPTPVIDPEPPTKAATPKEMSITFQFEENCGDISPFTESIQISTTIKELSERIKDMYFSDNEIDIKYEETGTKITIDPDMTIEDVFDEIKSGGSFLFIGIKPPKASKPKSSVKKISYFMPKTTPANDCNKSSKDSKPQKPSTRNEKDDDEKLNSSSSVQKAAKPSASESEKGRQNHHEFRFEFQDEEKALDLRDDSTLAENEPQIRSEFGIGENDRIEFTASEEPVDTEQPMRSFLNQTIEISIQRKSKSNSKGLYTYYYQTNRDDEVSTIEFDASATVLTMKKSIAEKYGVSNPGNIKILFSGKDLLPEIYLDALQLGDSKLFVYIRSEEDILLMTAKALQIDNEYEYEYEEDE